MISIPLILLLHVRFDEDFTRVRFSLSLGEKASEVIGLARDQMGAKDNRQNNDEKQIKFNGRLVTLHCTDLPNQGFSVLVSGFIPNFLFPDT